MKYSKEQLRDAYVKLPQELKDIFMSVDITDSITEIGKKFNLHIDQIGELNSEIGLVLLGLTPPSEFVDNLIKRLSIERVPASQIAAEANANIFLKVRELLKNIQLGVRSEPRTTPDANSPYVSEQEGPVSGERPGSVSGIAGERPNTISDAPLHPTRDALLAAIENPESGQDGTKVGSGANPPIGRERTEPTFVPSNPPSTPSDILEQKLASQVNMPTVKSVQKTDPYREQVN